MEGINILATKMVLDYGVGSLWTLIFGLLFIGIGIIALINTDNCVGFFAGMIAAGIITTLLCLSYIFVPVKAHIATIEDDVPYKYIEEHYIIKDKTDNLYTLIPLKEE